MVTRPDYGKLAHPDLPAVCRPLPAAPPLQTLDSPLPSQENVVNNCGLVLDPPLKGLRKKGGTWNV
jgi:hypothetical protein